MFLTKVTVRLAASGDKTTHMTRTMVVPKARDLALELATNVGGTDCHSSCLTTASTSRSSIVAYR